MPVRAWIGLAIVILFVLVAVLAPLIASQDPGNLRERRTPPFWQEEGTLTYPLGTDQLGRDVWSRLVYGARTSLIVALGALAVGAALGTAAGFIFGRFRGPWDYIYDRLRLRFGAWLLVMLIPFSFLLVHYSGKQRALVLITSVLYCLEVAGAAFLIHLVLIVFVLGVSKASLILAFGLVTWGWYAKYIRSAVMRSTPSEAIPQNRLTQYALPEKPTYNTLPQVFRTLAAMAISQVGFLIVMELVVSLLGAGVPPPTPSWGGMVADGQHTLSTAWWVSAFPAICIILLVTGCCLLGSGLRDRFGSASREPT